jgi:hypothetical protein
VIDDDAHGNQAGLSTATVRLKATVALTDDREL